eukprot:817494-Rhodomonas_salina.1
MWADDAVLCHRDQTKNFPVVRARAVCSNAVSSTDKAYGATPRLVLTWRTVTMLLLALCGTDVAYAATRAQSLECSSGACRPLPTGT